MYKQYECIPFTNCSLPPFYCGGAVEPFKARNMNLEKHIRFGVRLIVVIVPLGDITSKIEEFLRFLRLLFFFRTNRLFLGYHSRIGSFRITYKLWLIKYKKYFVRWKPAFKLNLDFFDPVDVVDRCETLETRDADDLRDDKEIKSGAICFFDSNIEL